MRGGRLALGLSSLLLVSCGAGTEAQPAGTTSTTTATTSSAAPTTAAEPVTTTTATPAGPVTLEVSEIARGLDTVWSLAWDPSGTLWYTERPGRVTRTGEAPRTVAGVVEQGEGGLMGLEIDAGGRVFVMYTGASDNRVVRLEPDGSQITLVEGIAKASIHNGGRLRFDDGGQLLAATGDAGRAQLAPDPATLNGKVLRLDPDAGRPQVLSRGHRNVQGLCPAGDGRLFATEHGPDRGDEINVVVPGFDGGWPATTGNGIRNYTPTIAPSGCAVYEADLIPGWRGSLLFTTLKGQDLRRLTLADDGSVSSEEVLFDGELGRLRDVAVGPDGAVYLATSNRDSRGSPTDADDRILRVAPAG